jgi:hypothetical protein
MIGNGAEPGDSGQSTYLTPGDIPAPWSKEDGVSNVHHLGEGPAALSSCGVDPPRVNRLPNASQTVCCICRTPGTMDDPSQGHASPRRRSYWGRRWCMRWRNLRGPQWGRAWRRRTSSWADGGVSLPGAAVRPAQSLLVAVEPLLLEPSDPLVGRLPGDAEPFRQLANRGVVQPVVFEEPQSLLVHGNTSPRHRWSPPRGDCHPCP